MNAEGVPGTSEIDLTQDPTERFAAYQELGKKGGMLGIPTGFAKIDEATAGLQGGQLITVIAPPKTGKALHVDAPVLTPEGWMRMGDLTTEHSVIGPDGKPTRVVAVHPQGEVSMYRVATDDGGTTLTCGDHLWTVRPHGYSEATLTTRELAERIKTNNRFAYLPITDPAPGWGVTPPVNPWLVGALIGDGGLTQATPLFTKSDPTVIRAVKNSLPLGVRMVKMSSRYTYSLRGDAGVNPLTEALVVLGLQGVKSINKHLPTDWEGWSAEHRWGLLAGLLDTDGSVEKNSVKFNTSSSALAREVQSLVWSLGGTANITQRPGRYIVGGVRHETATAYRVTLRVGRNPFRYSKKVAQFDSRPSESPRPPTRRIVSITPVGTHEAQCITVDRADGLFVCEDYLVTHNSQLAMSVGVNVHEADYSVMFQSFEMSNREQQERHDALRAKISHGRLRRGLLRPGEEKAYLRALQAMEGRKPFHLTDAVSGLTVTALTALIENKQPDLVIVDGVYLMLDEVTGESNTPQSLTNITRNLKRMAQRFDIPTIITTQTLLWKMRGGKVSADSIGYSSSFFQDSDVIIGLEPVEDDEEARTLKIVESRNCGKQEIPLVWNWDTACFHEVEKMPDCAACTSGNWS